MSAAPAKRVNLALQGGGSHGAYTWGVLDALLADERIEISGVSGASAGAMNAVVLAYGLQIGGGQGARERLEAFWLSVSRDGGLPIAARTLFAAWLGAWQAFSPPGWAAAASQLTSPYTFNPLDLNPLREHLAEAVDFDVLRRGESPKLFIAATNVNTGQGEIFRRDSLGADHVMASACLPRLFQAVVIDGAPYWDGGFSGNPPLWPLFYETNCRDTIIVQINPIARAETPHSAEDIGNRVNEITFNAGLLAELRAADFVARLIDRGVLKDPAYTRQRLHRIGGEGGLDRFGARTKTDVSWSFLKTLRDLGREAAREWLARHFDAIGARSTLDVAGTLRKAGGTAGRFGSLSDS